MDDELNPLKRAVKRGDVETARRLLDSGADIHYQSAAGYDVLIDAMYGGDIARDPWLIPLVQFLINRGAKLNTITKYSESALRWASREGRFDAVRLLLDAGGDPEQLRWTPVMHAIAIGSIDDVKAQLASGANSSATDYWSRTAWLLSIQGGDVGKAKYMLAAGANRMDRGHSGETPVMYAIPNGHAQMLHWLLSEGFNPDGTDESKQTPLMHACARSATECAKILIDAGVDIHLLDNQHQPAIAHAGNLDIVRLLLDRGASLIDLNSDMRRAITSMPGDREIHATAEEFFASPTPVFGATNPQKMNFPFWRAMVLSGACAYFAARKFRDFGQYRGPVWCFDRFGTSITELPDGRFIEIGGEHEDYSDDDFCIYNDVIVHHGDGNFDIYGYPKDCFAPTDFHTATLVGDQIYIIGSIGYRGERSFGQTPVYRLDIHSLEIKKIETSGESPGWISRHKATCDGDRKIRISGGKVCALADVKESYEDNPSAYVLELSTLTWSKVTQV